MKEQRQRTTERERDKKRERETDKQRHIIGGKNHKM